MRNYTELLQERQEMLKESASKDGTNPDGSTQGIDIKYFEHYVNELRTVIKDLESGNLSLEESLSAFSYGAYLSRIVKNILDNASLRVDEIMNEHSELFASLQEESQQ